ncbi:MAG: precorrin-8X methylmutase, partial [Pseudomonadota bacterium]|nr:precorrin-8X methylmutase [Pseudomonadota bacterium]
MIHNLNYLTDPEAIYQRSFAIIRDEADFSGLPSDFHPLITRLIHACGMIDLQEEIRFHSRAIESG